jgi:hypothetical protein
MLLGRGPINRGKLNALLIVSLVGLTAFYAFVEPIRHIIELTESLHSTEDQRSYVEVIAFFMICLTGFLSVRAVDQ